LLALIDPQRDSVFGDWRTVNGSIVSGTQAYARLRIPYAVPPEYDLHFQFTRLSGNDFVAAILCHTGRSFAWLNGGNGNTVDGFELVSEKHADQNATTKSPLPAEKTKGKIHDSVVQVRNGSIAAYVDGRLVSRHDTDFSDMSIPEAMSIGEDSIGLSTWQTSIGFSKIELVEVTGRGHPVPHQK
jgi:hypothetical protein